MDDLGNRESTTLRDGSSDTYSVDTTTNRYNSIDSATLAYDTAGNLTTDKDGYHYTYDYENRIVKIEDVNDVLVASMDYDALGRRIKVVDEISNATTYYYYSDNWQVLSEYNGSGTLEKNFVYGNYIDEVLVMNDGTNDYFFIHDHLFSPAALLNSSGSVLERYEYDAYGNTHIMDASYSTRTSSSYDNLYSFAGRQLDILDEANLHLLDFRLRTYNPMMGRFIQQDPLGTLPLSVLGLSLSPLQQYSDGMSLYEYIGSNPIWDYDPYGLFSWRRAVKAALQMLSGAFEMAVGMAMIGAPEPLTTAGGVVVTTMGANTFYAGVHNMMSAIVDDTAIVPEIQGPIHVAVRSTVTYVTNGNEMAAEGAVTAVNVLSVVCDCATLKGTLTNGAKVLTTSKIVSNTGVYSRAIITTEGVGYDVWKASVTYVSITQRVAGASAVTIDAVSTSYTIVESGSEISEYWFQSTAEVTIEKTFGGEEE